VAGGTPRLRPRLGRCAQSCKFLAGRFRNFSSRLAQLADRPARRLEVNFVGPEDRWLRADPAIRPSAMVHVVTFGPWHQKPRSNHQNPSGRARSDRSRVDRIKPTEPTDEPPRPAWAVLRGLIHQIFNHQLPRRQDCLASHFSLNRASIAGDRKNCKDRTDQARELTRAGRPSAGAEPFQDARTELATGQDVRRGLRAISRLHPIPKALFCGSTRFRRL
jgi:hypothetical protein